MISSLSLLVFSLCLFLLLLYKYSSPSPPKNERNTLPPSPPGLPIVGNIHQIGGLTHRSLHALAQRYGHLMLLKFGSVPTLVVTSAEAAEEAMKTHDLSFASRPSLLMADILLYGSRDMVFSPYGEYWRQVRRISVLHLLNVKQVKSFIHVREDEVFSMVRRIRSAVGGKVNLSELLVTYTNNIICRMALGRRCSLEEGGRRKYGEILSEFVELLGTFPLGDYIPWMAWVDTVSGLRRRARRVAIELDKLMEQILDDHIQEPSHDANDFVDIILSLKKEGSLGMSLSSDNIKGILLDMFVAGTDTTFTTLEWAMAEIMRNPGILTKVQDEVRNVVFQTCIRDEDISNMTYLKAIIKETLRLHPPLPLLVPRESMESSKLCGYEVPPKTKVIINAWAIGRDPKYWERAEEFIPDRFLNSPLDFKGLDFHYIPFGAGRRGCPGISFGVSTIEHALANLLYHFNWEMQDAHKGEDMNMTEAAGIVVHKKSNLLLVASPQSL